MEKKWIASFSLLLCMSLLGIFSYSSVSEVPLGGEIVAGDVAWMLTATCLVFLMTPGLAFFYGGMVRKNNVISTMLQSLTSMGVISVLWVVIGFSLSFGDSIGGFLGNPLTFFMFNNVGESTHFHFAYSFPFALFAMFQLKFAIITPALITGAFAERIRFSAYLLFISLFSLFIYSPIAHWTWHPDGFLNKLGVLDFAGGAVVHISAGFAALAGSLALGKRVNHFPDKSYVPANIPFVLLGTGMLWFGWFGFNAGSAFGASGLASLAFVTTNTASSSAMLGWIFFDALLGKKPSALGACIGAVVGLVAITPAAGFVNVGQSVFIGFSSSIVSNLVVHWKSKSTLDDTLDVFPCHGVGGIFGMLATGIFAKDVGLIYGNSSVFLSHVFALFLVSSFAFFGSYFLYKITDMIIPLRVSKEQEYVGLDISQHGETLEIEVSGAVN